MDLDPQTVRDALDAVDRQGWDSAAGTQLLDHVRAAVVLPVVRRTGLRGAAADQAAASGWSAAWDALRRPSARRADNPGGMVWSAVRRAVWAEWEADRGPWSGPAGVGPTSGPPRATSGVSTLGARTLSMDQLLAAGWQPAVSPDEDPVRDAQREHLLPALVDGLVEAGWNRAEVAEAIALMADRVVRAAGGAPATPWRWVALRLGLPQWQARRLAGLLLGGADWPGVLEIAACHGPQVLTEPAVQAAIGCTSRQWADGPRAWLVGWERTPKAA